MPRLRYIRGWPMFPHNQRADNIGQDMTEHNPNVRGANGMRCFDEFLFTHRKHLARVRRAMVSQAVKPIPMKIKNSPPMLSSTLLIEYALCRAQCRRRWNGRRP